MRNKRLKRFKKRSKGLILTAKFVSIWYLLIISGSYLTSNTGAYFNDVETVNGSITTAEDFCEGLNGSSEYWHKYCKDNAGIGNGPEPSDEDTGEKTDPDNPGKNKDDCDDYTSAPCTEDQTQAPPKKEEGQGQTPAGEDEEKEQTPTKENEEQEQTPPVGNEEQEQIPPGEEEQELEQTLPVEAEVEEPAPPEETTQPVGEILDLKGVSKNQGNSGWMAVTWKNPDSPDFSHVNVYKDGQSQPLFEKIHVQKVEIKGENNPVIYRITTVDKTGTESTGIMITVSNNGITQI